MIRRLRCGLLLAAASALATGPGCGGAAATSSRDEATVHGTVTLKGRPMTRGKVLFNPANINRKDAGTAEAAIAKDGTYTLKTLVGSNLISVVSPDTAKDPVLQYFTKHYDVKGGDNTCEIDVKAPE